MKIVWVRVELLSGCSDPDDAAGLWEVTLDEDVADEGHAAGAALDAFHGSVAISMPEDFEISTLNPENRQDISEAEDYQQGSGPDAVVERISDSEMDLGPSR